MKRTVKGNISGKEYSPCDVVRILDPRQAALYWHHHVPPLDVYPSRDYETGRALMVFVFNREDTREVFDLWCKHELK